MTALCLVALGVAVGARPGGAQPTSARLTGVVRDTAGGVIRGAIISIGGTSRRAESDSAGRFVFDGASTGRLVLRVRRLGFRPESLVVDPSSSGMAREVSFRLAPIAQLLDPVDVVANAEVYRARLAGFEHRRTLKVGHFVTRLQIDRLNATHLADVLRGIPGVRVGALNGLSHAVRLRGARCAPLVWIDGFPARADEVDLEMIDPASIEGIEVYASESSIPPEFMGTGAELSCGVIVLWSRPARR